jgi:bifunctional UDP-N-acetylglucosamine pyrophosphorylase/glucosamine-1-phosphate N-acetyltransferase
MQNDTESIMNTMQVIILAGGKGTRMESDEPKALTLLDTKPFLQHILDTVHTFDLAQKPIVIVGYKKEHIYEQIGNDQCMYAVQEEQLGTGDAVKAAKMHITDTHAPVMVLYADHPLISADTIEKLVLTTRNKVTDCYGDNHCPCVY